MPRSVQPRRVLDHPVRARVYRHLLVLPGDYLRSIVRCLNLPLGTVCYHLSVLILAGFVCPIRAGSRTRYYPMGAASHPQMNQLFEKYWRHRDVRTRVLVAVRRIQDPSPSSVGRALGVSRQLVLYHLRFLESLGVIQRVGGRCIPVWSGLDSIGVGRPPSEERWSEPPRPAAGEAAGSLPSRPPSLLVRARPPDAR